MVLLGFTSTTRNDDTAVFCRSGLARVENLGEEDSQGGDCLFYIQGPPIEKFGDGTGLWAGTTKERPRGHGMVLN
jgi:hypothetical protein